MSELRDRIAEALYENSVRELGFGLPDHKGRTAVPWDRLPEGAKESWYPPRKHQDQRFQWAACVRRMPQGK